VGDASRTKDEATLHFADVDERTNEGTNERTNGRTGLSSSVDECDDDENDDDDDDENDGTDEGFGDAPNAGRGGTECVSRPSLVYDGSSRRGAHLYVVDEPNRPDPND